MVLSTQLL